MSKNSIKQSNKFKNVFFNIIYPEPNFIGEKFRGKIFSKISFFVQNIV